MLTTEGLRMIDDLDAAKQFVEKGLVALTALYIN